MMTVMEYFETFIRYVLSAGNNFTKRDVKEIIKKIETIYLEGSGVVMTLADMFREEGKTKALAETTMRLLDRKFGILSEEFKERIAKLDAKTLEVIIDGIFEYESLDDVQNKIDVLDKEI